MCFQFTRRANAYGKDEQNLYLLLLPDPSAIFEGIETAPRLIWAVNPNLSFSGN